MTAKPDGMCEHVCVNVHEHMCMNLVDGRRGGQNEKFLGEQKQDIGQLERS